MRNLGISFLAASVAVAATALIAAPARTQFGKKASDTPPPENARNEGADAVPTREPASHCQSGMRRHPLANLFAGNEERGDRLCGRHSGPKTSM